jgi:ribosomal protein S20
MANLKSSKKDALRNEKNRLINRQFKEKIKNLKKTVYNMALNKNTQDAQLKFRELVSTIAKATKKNIYKKNKMARVVSRFHLRIKNLGCFQ